LLPLISLAICSFVLQIVPNFRLTSDKELGDVPLVGVSSVPGLRLAGSPHWGPIWVAVGF
jgi:hypothetical protein